MSSSTQSVTAAIDRNRTHKTDANVFKVPLKAPNDHGLFQATPEARVFRQHMEPFGNVENGTVSKLDWMLDPYDGYKGIPYDDSDVSYRIFNIFTKTGDDAGLNGENGAAVIGTKNRGDGNTWGIFTSMHYGFNDGKNVPMKLIYMDTSDTEWRKPMKNFWYKTKPLNTGDYVLYKLSLYKSLDTGVCGDIAPTHMAGTVSDGSLRFEFVRDYSTHVNDIDACVLFGDVGSMPRFGHPNKPVQYAKDTLHWTHARDVYESAGQQTTAGLVKVGVRTDAEEFQLEFFNNNRFRFGKDHYRTSGIVRRFESKTLSDADVVNGKIDVKGYELIYTNFLAPTLITGVINALPDQRLQIISMNANTTFVNGTALRTRTGANDTPSPETGRTYINSAAAGRLREV